MKSSKIFSFWLILQILFSQGWGGIYPFYGYVLLITNIFVLIILAHYKKLNTSLILFFFLFGIIYYLIPRDYGEPNVTWFLFYFGFLLVLFNYKIFLNYKFYNDLNNFVLFLCLASFFYTILIYFGVDIPYTVIEEGP